MTNQDEARPLTAPEQHSLNRKMDALALKLDSHIDTNDRDHASLKERLLDHLKDEQHLHGHVFGNGGVGLAEQIRNALREIGAMRSAVERRDRVVVRILWVVATPILLGALGLLWQIAKTYIRDGVE